MYVDLKFTTFILKKMKLDSRNEGVYQQFYCWVPQNLEMLGNADLETCEGSDGKAEDSGLKAP